MPKEGNLRTFDAVIGRHLTFTTLPLVHNQYGQVASWSELNDFQALVSPVPEPPMPALMLLGLAMIGGIHARRKSQAE